MGTRTMKFWSFLPWLCGAALLAGPVASQQNALVFYRAMLLIAVTVATAGALRAATSFERGDALLTTWAVLGGGYVLLWIRYVMSRRHN